jgi:hypothetical protein
MSQQLQQLVPEQYRPYVPQMDVFGYSVVLDAGNVNREAGGMASLDLFQTSSGRGDAGLAGTFGWVAASQEDGLRYGYPGQDGAISGLYTGIGPHFGVSNAKSKDDLAGHFTQYSVNFGAVESLAAQVSIGRNIRGQLIYVVSFDPRIAPLLGAGIGISFSKYQTDTRILLSQS